MGTNTEVMEKLDHVLEEIGHIDPSKKTKHNLTNAVEILHELRTGMEKRIFNTIEADSQTSCGDIENELRSLMMRNAEVLNLKMRSDLELHRKIEEVKQLAGKIKSLQDDVVVNRLNTMTLNQFFETKAKTADKRIHELSQELVKTQELAKKFQNLMEQQARSFSSSEEANSLTNAEKNQFQAMMTENETMKRDLGQLRSENNLFSKRMKRADDERVAAMNRYATSEAARESLKKRLTKLEKEHKSLKLTMTQTASEWVARKKELKTMKEDMKWKLINPSPSFNPELSSLQGSLPRNIYAPKRIVTPRPYTAIQPTSF